MPPKREPMLGSGIINVNTFLGAIIIAISGWALAATLENGKSNVSIEKDVKYLKEELPKFVTKTELELTQEKLHNEQLKFQVEFLKAAKEQPAVQPTTKR